MLMLEHQSTTLLSTPPGSITYTSRPSMLLAAKGELSIATLVWEVSTCYAEDKSPFIHVGPLL